MGREGREEGNGRKAQTRNVCDEVKEVEERDKDEREEGKTGGTKIEM